MNKRGATESNRPAVAPTVLYRPPTASAAPAGQTVSQPPPTRSGSPAIEVVRSVPPEGAEAPAVAPSRVDPEPSSGDRMPFQMYLQRAREARGMTLDDLAHQTKIRRAILEAVENDARRELPEKVFVLGYVRSYALAVGLPVEEAARRFQLAWDDEAIEPELLEAVRPKRSFAWIAPLAASFVLAAVVWFIVTL